MFLSFLLNNRMLVAFLVLLAVALGEGIGIMSLRSDKAILVAEKVTLTTMLTESQANLKQLQNDIQSQNSAIDTLKSAADLQVVQHAAEVKQAQDIAISYKKKADELLTAKAPANMTKCDAANAIINGEIKDAHK